MSEKKMKIIFFTFSTLHFGWSSVISWLVISVEHSVSYFVTQTLRRPLTQFELWTIPAIIDFKDIIASKRKKTHVSKLLNYIDEKHLRLKYQNTSYKKKISVNGQVKKWFYQTAWQSHMKSSFLQLNMYKIAFSNVHVDEKIYFKLHCQTCQFCHCDIGKFRPALNAFSTFLCYYNQNMFIAVGHL